MAFAQQLRDQLDTSKEDEKKQREQLDFLLTAAKAKLQVYTSELTMMLTDPQRVGAIKVAGAPVHWTQEYRANITQKANDQIGKAVDSFFTGNSGILDGLKSLVNLGISAILGNTAIGEQELQTFFVTVEHNAIVRVDVKFWRYNFSSKGVISTCDNAFCYVFCKCVVDHKAVSPDVYLYLLSEQLGDDLAKVKPYLEQLSAVWKELASTTSVQAIRERFVKAIA